MGITTTIPTNINFPHRGVLERDAFVLAQEAAQDLLAGGYTTALNQYANELNSTQTDINAKWTQVQNQAVTGSYSQSYIDGNFVHLSGNETISGTKTFSISPIVPTPTTTGNIITMDNIVQKTAVGIGYGTGAGGTVTQLTSKSTAVTLNKPTGTITMNNAALAAGASVTFILYNSLVGDNDTSVATAKNGNYDVKTTVAVDGTIYIKVTNISVGSLSDALTINFIVIKGAIS